jgi:predicted phage tail protein
MMRDIYLHGALGRQYGRRWRLDVASPAEAVRALMVLRPPLRQALRVGDWRVVVGRPHLANAIDPAFINMRLGSQPLHLVPATRAAGNSGFGKIAVGVALIGATVLTAGLAAPAAVGTFAALGAEVAVGGVGLGFTYGSVALLGASMVLGGVGALLTTPPAAAPGGATATAPRPADRPSFLFNGVVNNSQQGAPVPLVFGTHLVGSIVVSSGLSAEDQAP